ncbi:heme biosynthesis HemY N-terminal domain-containing protein [Legionella fairfieldensis]|uniref:heme biosynthesis HemY N-terminal domain-containing protein n=1 Tax=Legionella fairfieldensis TaxID=45064 RepID=UPI00048AACD0|nr:heme biosynthesis HemY N-terminal domain-containing protein [Legionella fairfieldensis]
MIRLLIIFLILLASVYLGIQLSHDPGYLLLTLNHWSLETTLWVAVFTLIIVFFLLHGFLLLLAKIGRSPAAIRNWRAKRRALKAQAKTRQGLIEFSEGYWSQAKNHLIKALPDTDSPLLNYLTAARAAQEMGDNQLRDDYLREAQQSMPDAKIAVELTQAQLQLANQQWEQALATLRHLQDLAPHHPYVLKLLMHLYKEVKDWPQLIALLPELKKHQVITGKAFEKLQQQSYLQAMSDLARYSQNDALTKMVAQLPKNLTYDPELMAEYARFLIAHNESKKAEQVLRHCLRKHYDEQIITLYGLIPGNGKQLTFAESLLKKHPHSAAIYLCLGRLSLHNDLWGKAKSYFEKSITLTASPEAYEELGKLLERLNDQTGACTAYRQGLILANQQNSKITAGINK